MFFHTNDDILLTVHPYDIVCFHYHGNGTICTHIHAHTHTHTYTHTHTHTHAHTHTHTHTHTPVYTHTHTHTHRCTQIYTDTYLLLSYCCVCTYSTSITRYNTIMHSMNLMRVQCRYMFMYNNVLNK